MKKRSVILITFVVTVLAAILTATALTSHAEVYSGNCGAEGDNVKWSLDTDTGVLAITGTGDMKDYSRSYHYYYYNDSYYTYDTPWYYYRSSIKSIEIGYDVTGIGQYAFAECWYVTDVTVPVSVTTIGAGAFYGCENLEALLIPDSVTSIGAGAFYGCDLLKGVYYTGTDIVWKDIEIATDNDPLTNADITYGYHVHKWGEWEVTAEPTIYKAGEETRTCTTCGETETRAVAALPMDNPFTDVPAGKWFTKGVLYCNTKGYMIGISVDLFAPKATLTRAMFVTILSRIDEADTTTYTDTPFNDVPAGKWYSKPVAWAYANGYTAGTGGGNFSPKVDITRETLAQFFFTYSKTKGYDVTKAVDLAKYTDRAAISNWARKAVSWAVASGLIYGMTDTTLAPRATATRAQVALIVMNYVENIAG